MGESLIHGKKISAPSTGSKNSALTPVSACFFLVLLVKHEDGGDKLLRTLRNAQRYKPEDRTLHGQRYEYLKSNIPNQE
jgi:hypothetical protein